VFSRPRTTLASTEIPSAANEWSGQNFPGYANPEMDKALDAAERELDKEKRRGQFGEIQKLYAEDLPVLPMFFRVDPFAEIPFQEEVAALHSSEDALQVHGGDEVGTVLGMLVAGSSEAADALARAENAVILFGHEGLDLAGSTALAQACANLLITTRHYGRPNNGLIAVWPGKLFGFCGIMG